MPRPGNEPTLAGFSATGLNYERDITGLFLGDFKSLRLRSDGFEFAKLLGSYVTAFARQCGTYLPVNKVEITRLECATEQYMVNRYGVQVGASSCVQYREVGTGLYADPDLYAAARRVDAAVGVNATKDLFGLSNNDPIDTAMRARDAQATVGQDMQTLIAINGCATPGVQRFQVNMLRFARGESGLPLASGETLASIAPPQSASGTPFKDSNYTKLLDDLVAEQSKAWLMNRYISGSLSDVTVASRDEGGRPLEIVGQYAFDSLNGRSKGTVRVRFSGSLPQCVYFSDFPTTCRTPSPRIVMAYENNKYQQ